MGGVIGVGAEPVKNDRRSLTEGRIDDVQPMAELMFVDPVELLRRDGREQLRIATVRTTAANPALPVASNARLRIE